MQTHEAANKRLGDTGPYRTLQTLRFPLSPGGLRKVLSRVSTLLGLHMQTSSCWTENKLCEERGADGRTGPGGGPEDDKEKADSEMLLFLLEK